MPTNFTQEMYTLTGLTIEQALAKMSEILPPRAYKKVGGTAADLTDISPAFLTKCMNDTFGMVGIGWKFDFDPSASLPVREERVKRNGEKYEVYVSFISYLSLQYRFIDRAGEMHWSAPIVASGGADNEIPEWAARGALTNALGAAASKMNWQIGVYLGYVDHNNAEAAYKKQQAERAKNGQKPEVVEETTTTTGASADEVFGSQNQTTGVPSETEQAAPEPVAEVEQAEPAPVNEPSATKAAVQESQPDEGDPMLVMVPEDVDKFIPLRGKPLVEVIADKTFGVSLLKFFTGEFPSHSGKTFNPTTPAQVALMRAAKEVWEKHGEELVAKSKKK